MVRVPVSASTEPDVSTAQAPAAGFECCSANGAAVEGGATGGAGGREIPDDAERLPPGTLDSGGSSWLHASSSSELSSSAVSCLWLQWIWQNYLEDHFMHIGLKRI